MRRFDPPILGLVLLTLALGLAVAPAMIADDGSAEAPQTEVVPAATLQQPVADLAAFTAPAVEDPLVDSSEAGSCGEEVAGRKGKPCKPCPKDRRFCECSYNGLPRISCDPCCYSNGWGLPVCLD